MGRAKSRSIDFNVDEAIIKPTGRHYTILRENFSSSFLAVIGVYIHDNRIEWKWLLVDFLLLFLIGCLLLDFMNIIIGASLGELGLGNTMVAVSQESLKIDDPTLLNTYSYSNFNGELTPLDTKYGINVNDNYYSEIRNKPAIKSRIYIQRIMYPTEIFDEFSNAGNKTGTIYTKDIMVNALLIVCPQGDRKTCNVTPAILSKDNGLIYTPEGLSVQFTGMSFSFERQSNGQADKKDIVLDYTLNERVNRPYFMYTTEYLNILPNLAIPKIISMWDEIKKAFKINFI